VVISRFPVAGFSGVLGFPDITVNRLGFRGLGLRGLFDITFLGATITAVLPKKIPLI